MGPSSDLDRRGKSRSPPRFDPRTVQPVASRYTDCDVPIAKFIYRQMLDQVSGQRAASG